MEMDAKTSLNTTLLALLCLLLCPPALAAEKVTLQLSAAHQTRFAGYYVAHAKGFYSQHGFDVEILENSTGKVPWQEIVSGNADYAIDDSSAFTAFSRGQPLVALAAVMQRSSAIFISLESSAISNLADFRFRNVMMRPGGQEPELLALLKSRDISLNDLQLMPTSADISDLLAGRTDVISGHITDEPYILQQAGVPFRQFSPLEQNIEFYSGLLITHRERVLNSPHQVNQFRKASLKGWQYALAHPEEALQLITPYLPEGQSADQIRYALNILRQLVAPQQQAPGNMDPARWQQIAADLQRMDLIPDTAPDIDRFIYDNGDKAFRLQGTGPWMLATLVLLTIGLVSLAANIVLHQRLQTERAQRQKSEHRLKHLAAHDLLTQLPNRSAMIEQLTMLLKLAHRHHTTPALFYIDIDGFKTINETLGQKSGDELLIKFSNRVRSTLRESDLFGRLGSDEFLLIVDESTEEGTSHLAMKLMEQLNKPFLVDEQDIKISASIGIARYTDSGETADELIRRADSAMFKVKNSFRAGFSMAHPPTLP